MLDKTPKTEVELEESLSRPTAALVEAFARIEGDIIVLGAGGKMGPSLTRMARRATEQSGTARNIFAAARFTDPQVESVLKEAGIVTVRCDLLDRDSVQQLPDAANVIFMAGQKFGTTDSPERTWAVNILAPALAAERYSESRVVAFSTGCVYPDSPNTSSGSKEGDPLEPLGEYANSCVGRERIFEHYSKSNRTPMAFVRLNYANDLRYGVIAEIGRAVWEGRAIDVSTGCVNVIWQGDANAMALRLLEHTACPPLAVNITGPAKVSVRSIAEAFGALFGKIPTFEGHEGSNSLLSDASLSRELLGEPGVSLEQMIEWTAGWIRLGGRQLNKPTHFQTRDGRF